LAIVIESLSAEFTTSNMFFGPPPARADGKNARSAQNARIGRRSARPQRRVFERKSGMGLSERASEFRGERVINQLLATDH
jgi:hypothetical protein